MSEPNYRIERIDRLLKELRYEIERGMLEREIDETLAFTFYVPISRQGTGWVVGCEFRTRPTPAYAMPSNYLRDGPKLRVIDGGKP